MIIRIRLIDGQTLMSCTDRSSCSLRRKSRTEARPIMLHSPEQNCYYALVHDHVRALRQSASAITFEVLLTNLDVRELYGALRERD